MNEMKRHFPRKKTHTSRSSSSARINSGKSQKQCIVCHSEEGVPKYKCPKCREPYCSVACCKIHKDSCLVVVSSSSSTTTPTTTTTTTTTPIRSNNSNARSNYLTTEIIRDPLRITGFKRPFPTEEVEQGWRITNEMKQAMDNSTWLRKELLDGGLRQLISEIDSSSGISTERAKALYATISNNANFRGFIDQLLVTAGVLKMGDHDRLVLAHPPLKQCQQKQERQHYLNTINSSSDTSSSSSSDEDDSKDTNE